MKPQELRWLASLNRSNCYILARSADGVERERYLIFFQNFLETNLPTSMDKKKTVLILCTENTARSQMAEGLLRNMAGDRFEVLSAGTQPADAVHPLAFKAMQEIGIDISGQHPKDIATYLARPSYTTS